MANLSDNLKNTPPFEKKTSIDTIRYEWYSNYSLCNIIFHNAIIK